MYRHYIYFCIHTQYILLFKGVVTNMLNIVTLVRSLRKLNSSMYRIFLGMACADFGVSFILPIVCNQGNMKVLKINYSFNILFCKVEVNYNARMHFFLYKFCLVQTFQLKNIWRKLKQCILRKI